MNFSKKRRNDIVLITSVLVFAVLFTCIYLFTRHSGTYVAVVKDGTEIARYSLSYDCEIPISSDDIVTNILVIKDGRANISSALCSDQICVKHRAVSKIGETIVCLPNKLVIKIVGVDNVEAPDMVV